MDLLPHSKEFRGIDARQSADVNKEAVAVQVTDKAKRLCQREVNGGGPRVAEEWVTAVFEPSLQSFESWGMPRYDRTR